MYVTHTHVKNNRTPPETNSTLGSGLELSPVLPNETQFIRMSSTQGTENNQRVSKNLR
jgi:hypothetical protein